MSGNLFKDTRIIDIHDVKTNFLDTFLTKHESIHLYAVNWFQGYLCYSHKVTSVICLHTFKYI